MRLDHLFGRTVEKISTHEKQPALVFDGDTKLVYTDKRLKWQDSLVGQRFMSIDETNDHVRLLFNNEGHTLSKDKIVIVGSDGQEHEAYAPYPDISADIPADPSVDRIKPDEVVEEEARRELENQEEAEEESE